MIAAIIAMPLMTDRVYCPCGTNPRRIDYVRHRESPKHMAWLLA
jgi:hypothetical protein